MKVRTVRQVKQQRPRFRRNAAAGTRPTFHAIRRCWRWRPCTTKTHLRSSHGQPLINLPPPSPLRKFAGGNESSASSSGAYKPVPPPKPVSPPYRMPPQPPGASSLYGEPSIPGAATASDAPLRTHSAKYPVSGLCIRPEFACAARCTYFTWCACKFRVPFQTVATATETKTFETHAYTHTGIWALFEVPQWYPLIV